MKLLFPIALTTICLVLAGAAATAPKFRPTAELAGRADISAAYAEAAAF